VQYNLPKKYLSYSSWSLWKKNKDAFRRKYYLNEPSFETVETIFGKKIAKMLEDKEAIKLHPILSNVFHYPLVEYPIDIIIEDIPIKGYIDTFDDKLLYFREYKTGHLGRDGKFPWDSVKVSRHDQLPFYSFLIEEKFGEVNNTTHLDWIETKWREKSMDFSGHTLVAESRELELTGKIETFKRIIYKWERKLIKEDIIKVAKEISEDYTNFLKTNENK
jgi:hypothetical protein